MYQTNRRFDLNATCSYKKNGYSTNRRFAQSKKIGIEQIVDQKKTDLTMKTMGEGNRRLDL